VVITAVWTSGGSLRKRRATARQQAVDILQRIGDGFYALDSEERLTYVNPQTEQLWGLSREQLVGNRLWDVFPQAIGTHAPGAPASSTSASSPTGTTVYFRDISARKQAEDAAQEAVRVRDDVLRAVSHDLRNPPSAVKGHAQILERWALKRDLPESELLIRGLRQIDAAAMRMSSWIEELLDVTRLELGQQLPLHLTGTDLVQLVRESVADHQQARHHHQFHVREPDAPLVGAYDAARLRRASDNLLSNAIKYTPQGGDIMVELEQQVDSDGTWAVIKVPTRVSVSP